MQVNPESQTFSEIFDLEKEEKKFQDFLDKNSLEAEDVIVQGSKENLQKLQNDLRKVGYKKLR